MTVEYLDLVDYLAIAAEVTGIPVTELLRTARLELADSALHAPSAGFGEVEFHVEFLDKAAALLIHLARNHPLPDGNKRAAWTSLRTFIEINGWEWLVGPDVDDAERAVVAVASGEWDQGRTVEWLVPLLEQAQ